MGEAAWIVGRATLAAALSILFFVGIPGLDLDGAQIFAPAVFYGLLVLAPEVRNRGLLGPQRVKVVLFTVVAYWAALMAYLPLLKLMNHDVALFAIPVVGAALVWVVARRTIGPVVSLERFVAVLVVGCAAGLMAVASSADEAMLSSSEWALVGSVFVWQVGTAIALLAFRGDAHRSAPVAI